MDVFSGGPVVEVQNAPHGTVFAFRRSGTTFLATKLANDQTVAVLWPHHPQNPNAKASLVGVNYLANIGLWLMPKAVSVPPSDPTQVRSRAEFHEEIGALILAGENSFVCVDVPDRSPAYVNLRTGDLVYEFPPQFVWFESWSIKIPTVDGFGTFCTIPS